MINDLSIEEFSKKYAGRKFGVLAYDEVVAYTGKLFAYTKDQVILKDIKIVANDRVVITNFYTAIEHPDGFQGLLLPLNPNERIAYVFIDFIKLIDDFEPQLKYLREIYSKYKH